MLNVVHRAAVEQETEGSAEHWARAPYASVSGTQSDEVPYLNYLNKSVSHPDCTLKTVPVAGVY